MLQLIKSSFWSFLSVLVRALSSIAINKLFATFYGPNGITLYAHFQNLISIITTVPDGGTNVGIIKFIASGQKGTQKYQHYFWAGIFLNLLCVFAALGLIFGYPGYYLGVFIEGLDIGKIWLWCIYFGVGSLLLTLNLQLLAVILARRELKWHVLSTTFMTLAGMAVIYFTHGSIPLTTVLLLVLGVQSLSFFLMLGVLYAKSLLPSIKDLSVPREIYKDLWKYILMALSAVVCLKLTNFYVRDFVMDRLDLYQAGLWQSVVRVSENYSAVYTAILGMLYYPQMSALINDEEVFRKFVRNTFYLALPVLALGLLLIYFLRDWILLLLFNKDFVQAAYLFDYQLLGDFFRMWSIVLTYLIVVRADVKLYIGWQVVSALFYIVLVSFLIEPLGLEGITMAHSIRYAATLIFAILYYHKYVRL